MITAVAGAPFRAIDTSETLDRLRIKDCFMNRLPHAPGQVPDGARGGRAGLPVRPLNVTRRDWTGCPLAESGAVRAPFVSCRGLPCPPRRAFLRPGGPMRSAI